MYDAYFNQGGIIQKLILLIYFLQTTVVFLLCVCKIEERLIGYSSELQLSIQQ
jgi:hypothetical protein